MKASDPRYQRMEALITMRAVLTNPHMHLRDYDDGNKANRVLANQELADAIHEVDKAQAALLIQEA